MIKSILGPNSYMAHTKLGELLSKLSGSGIERVSGENVDIISLGTMLRSQSLFTNPTVVVSNISEQKSLHEDFIELLESLDDQAALIIYEPTVDKRSKYYKYLIANTDASEFKNLGPNELPNWITEEFSKRGGTIDRGSARYLGERIGEDQWRISNEIDKLIAYGKDVNRSVIDELVEPTPDENIFRLLDLILSGNAKAATEQYDKLIFQRMDPNYILSMLAWQLHIIALIVNAKDRTADQIAKDAGVSPFVVKKAYGTKAKISKNKLVSMLELAVQFDADAKSKPINTTEAMKQLIIKLSQK